MKTAIAGWAAVLTASVSGMAVEKCCFGLTAYGGPGGVVRQLSDGQNRIGDDSLPVGKYCLGSDGGVIDGKQRGCILTPPTTQWQCDEGADPTKKFGLTCNGTLTHDDGDTTFYSCPTGQRGGWNIYSKTLAGEPNCKPIWLRADNCFSGCTKTSTVTADCPSTSSKCTTSTTSSKCTTPTTSRKCTTSSTSSKCKTSSTSSKCTTPTTSSKCTTSSKSTSSKCTTSSASSKCTTSSKSTSSKCTTSSTSSKCRTSSVPPPPPPPKTSCTSSKKVPPPPKETCPALLSGNNWEFPHLIVPISKSKPDKAYGTVFNGTASPDVSSVFQFDIPKSAAGKTCNLQFYLPKQHQLETSAFELKGQGKFAFHTAYPAASTKTTYNNAPKPAYPFGTFELKPGNAYQIGSHACPSGDVATFIMSAVGKSYLNYFQDYNPCPIGLYITVS